jgi:hypothetical protein
MSTTKLTTLMLVAAAAFPSAASALPQELRSPNVRDAALQSERSTYQDLRNPDTRGDALAADRAPAARPAARVKRTAAADGFDWGDAGIGATGMLGLLAAAGGAFLVVAGQRFRPTNATRS